ncbi:MAG: hypothetical protein A2912_03460 [Candidatus Buchananbacteria bacterium RIFCSPLOWO2_01_FULL_40_23b]|uniref:Uncharacterized protein n=1 Tax=Candidatus Buchananbacteria bacterium RIFCSPLOWO2_01_FULL_40_23b TaxID=1797544 RepID=A0A1G1YUJ4_9BACT|nr:MAG: hypothetical protein A2912_03460 [Candidatus Buchananbacteria bacterium RIFCSPLOWO2_01_FULL_40_23b]
MLAALALCTPQQAGGVFFVCGAPLGNESKLSFHSLRLQININPASILQNNLETTRCALNRVCLFGTRGLRNFNS